MLLSMYGLCVLATLAGAGFLLLGLWAFIFRRYGWLCPGPEAASLEGQGRTWRRVAARALPWRWFLRRACGYDLSGHEPDCCGAVRCPECGGVQRYRRLTGHALRVRPIVLGAVLIAGGRIGLETDAIQFERVLVQAPTEALMMVEEYGGTFVPREVQHEVRERIRSTILSESESERAARILVNDLRDDDVAWNAMEARALLQNVGPGAHPQLHAALDSTDYQLRQQVATVLRNDPTAEPTEALLRASLEGLRDDDIDGYDFANAKEGTWYLALHARLAEAQLRAGLASDDWQQRLLSAVAVAWSGETALLPEAVPVLVEHLRDNDIRQDSRIARTALQQLGRESLELLEPYEASPDAQQARSVADVMHAIARSEERPPAERHRDDVEAERQQRISYLRWMYIPVDW